MPAADIEDIEQTLARSGGTPQDESLPPDLRLPIESLREQLAAAQAAGDAAAMAAVQSGLNNYRAAELEVARSFQLQLGSADNEVVKFQKRISLRRHLNALIRIDELLSSISAQ